MPGDEGGAYIHGTHREETLRLTRLNGLLNPRALRELALAPGDRVLDVGSGLGLLSLEMAAAVGPRGRVLGIERDRTQLAAALQALGRSRAGGGVVEFRRGDATKLPLRPGEWGGFDVAFCRFLLEHVREPERVVEGMAQAVRPGGRVVLEDDDHDLLRLWPPVPGFEPVWRAYVEAYRERGCDPAIGRRLVELLCAAGLQAAGCSMPCFGSCAGREDFDLYVDNLRELLEGARGAIQSRGKITEAELGHCLAALEAWGRRKDAAFWYVTCRAEGYRPEPVEAA